MVSLGFCPFNDNAREFNFHHPHNEWPYNSTVYEYFLKCATNHYNTWPTKYLYIQVCFSAAVRMLERKTCSALPCIFFANSVGQYLWNYIFSNSYYLICRILDNQYQNKHFHSLLYSRGEKYSVPS